MVLEISFVLSISLFLLLPPLLIMSRCVVSFLFLTPCPLQMPHGVHGPTQLMKSQRLVLLSSCHEILLICNRSFSFHSTQIEPSDGTRVLPYPAQPCDWQTKINTDSLSPRRGPSGKNRAHQPVARAGWMDGWRAAVSQSNFTAEFCCRGWMWVVNFYVPWLT